MSETPEKVQSETQDEVQKNRRGFIKGAATGLMAVGVTAALNPSKAAAQQDNEVQDPQAPPGLNPMGLVDSRYPITYEKSVPAATRVITNYYLALVKRDLNAMADVFHYPFASYEGTEPVVVESREQLLAHAPASINMTENPERFTDHDGYLKPGAYDVLDGIEVLNSDPIRVNLALCYNRYDKDGFKILRCEGIYCVTNNDGKWGIQLMSTIFKPAAMVATVFQDTLDACKRLRADHCLAFQANDGTDLNRTRQFGKQASITGGSFSYVQNLAINGKPMEVFRTKGVKTRLVVNEVPEDVMDRPSNNADFSKSAREMYAKVGKGIKWGILGGDPPGARVVHQWLNKAHMYSGITRFTPAGEEINTTMELDVVTYKKGHWGIAGSPLTFAYVTTHDRVNDI